MKARSSLIGAGVIAVLAAFPGAATAQATFEGVVTMRTSMGPNGPQDMTYSVKGGKARVDLETSGMQMSMLFNSATKTMDVLIPMRQMYMERAMDDMSATADSAAAKAKIKWTGSKETIAGYECEHANITDDNGKTADVCLAKGLGSFMMMGGGMGGRGASTGGGWEEQISGMFPLKVTQDGQVQLEVTKVEKKSIDDALFAIPDGFQKMTMPMGGRGGGR